MKATLKKIIVFRSNLRIKILSINLLILKIYYKPLNSLIVGRHFILSLIILLSFVEMFSLTFLIKGDKDLLKYVGGLLEDMGLVQA